MVQVKVVDWRVTASLIDTVAIYMFLKWTNVITCPVGHYLKFSEDFDKNSFSAMLTQARVFPLRLAISFVC